MTESITSIERIEREARIAAHAFSDINDACPYPFSTEAGQLFKAEFLRARLVIAAGGYPADNTAPTATTAQQP